MKPGNRWFANGSGCIKIYKGFDNASITWNGRDDGMARYIPHVRRWQRGGVEYAGLAALLRGIEAEHAPKQA